MTTFTIRNSKSSPTSLGNNPLYMNGTSGISPCCSGYFGGQSTLPNCVGYSWGRFVECQELAGGTVTNKPPSCTPSKKYYDLYGGSKKLWGTDCVPSLGAIGILTNSSNSAGHVFNVEKINSDGSIDVSESGWGNNTFGKDSQYNFNYTTYYKDANGYYKSWTRNYGYHFVGFIYPDTPFDGSEIPTEKQTSFDGSKITSAHELARRATIVATQYKTLYVIGAWGLALNSEGVTKVNYNAHNGFNNQPTRREMIRNATNTNPLTWGFDCVCLLKALLWGWRGDESQIHGGATYGSNGQPDYGAEQIIDQSCTDISTDFSDIQVGELLGTTGHVGIYIGNGLGVECTPSWSNCVQITNVANIQRNSNYPNRTWKRHAKLSPLLTYDDNNAIDLNNLSSNFSSQVANSPQHIYGIGYFGTPIFDATQTMSFLVEREQSVTNIENISMKKGVTINSYGIPPNTANVLCVSPTYTEPVKINKKNISTNKLGIEIANKYFKDKKLDLRIYGYEENISDTPSVGGVIDSITNTSITLKYSVYKYSNNLYIKDILGENTSGKSVQWNLLVKYSGLKKDSIPFQNSDIGDISKSIQSGIPIGIESKNITITYSLQKEVTNGGIVTKSVVYYPTVANGMLYKINGEPYTTQSLDFEQGEVYTWISTSQMSETELQEIQTLIDNKVAIAIYGTNYEKIEDMPKWFQNCFKNLSDSGILDSSNKTLNRSEMRMLLWLYNSLQRHGSIKNYENKQFNYDV